MYYIALYRLFLDWNRWYYIYSGWIWGFCPIPRTKPFIDHKNWPTNVSAMSYRKIILVGAHFFTNKQFYSPM